MEVPLIEAPAEYLDGYGILVNRRVDFTRELGVYSSASLQSP